MTDSIWICFCWFSVSNFILLLGGRWYIAVVLNIYEGQWSQLVFFFSQSWFLYLMEWNYSLAVIYLCCTSPILHLFDSTSHCAHVARYMHINTNTCTHEYICMITNAASHLYMYIYTNVFLYFDVLLHVFVNTHKHMHSYTPLLEQLLWVPDLFVDSQ